MVNWRRCYECSSGICANVVRAPDGANEARVDSRGSGKLKRALIRATAEDRRLQFLEREVVEDSKVRPTRLGPAGRGCSKGSSVQRCLHPQSFEGSPVEMLLRTAFKRSFLLAAAGIHQASDRQVRGNTAAPGQLAGNDQQPLLQSADEGSLRAGWARNHVGLFWRYQFASLNLP